MVKRDLITYIILVLILVGLAIALRLFVLEPHTIRDKEANQLIFEKDIVLAVKPAHLVPGDLVLYQVEGYEHVGRLIAMPGDQVIYMDDVLYLNNQVKEEPYLTDLRQTYQAEISNLGYFTQDFTVETLTGTDQSKIPEGQYLILSDNRLHREDSQKYGLIPKKDIIGVINFRVFPIARFGFIQNTVVLEETVITP